MARPLSDLTKLIITYPDLSMEDVLAKAMAAGLPATAGNVYRVRRLHGAKPVMGGATATKVKTMGTKVKTIRPASAVTSAEAIFRNAVTNYIIEHGLTSALSVVNNVAERIRSVAL